MEPLDHFLRIRRYTIAVAIILVTVFCIFGILSWWAGAVWVLFFSALLLLAFRFLRRLLLTLLHTRERFEEMSNLLTEANQRYEERNTLLASKINELTTFRRITQAMTSSMDLEFIFKVILKAVTKDLGYDRAALCLLNEKRNILEGQVSSGWEDAEEIRRLKIPIRWAKSEQDFAGLDPFSRSLSQRRPLLVADLERWKDCPENLKHFFGKPHVMAVIPLVAKDNVVGALLVDNLVSHKPLEESDLRTLLTLSHQSGIAVENARLFTMEKNFNEELTRQIEIAKARLMETQNQLIQAERLAALGEMSAVVAHEVKNPMTSIRASTQLIAQGLKANDPVQKYVGYVKEQIDRLDRIVRSILTFSRPPKPHFISGDLNLLLSRTLSFMEKEIAEAGVKLETATAAKLPPLKMDPEQLQQVFINIIQNALHFTASQKVKKIKITTLQEGDDVVVHIEDTGGGIEPAENISKIFQPFFTTKTQGTGLGLTISQRIVEAHGGKISVTNRPGVGATFTIQIPQKVSEAVASQAKTQHI